MPSEHRNPTAEELDERIALPLDAETALRALLAVDMSGGWAVRRDGTDDEYLTRSGNWGSIATAAWFATEDDAAAVAVPEDTRHGGPRQRSISLDSPQRSATA